MRYFAFGDSETVKNFVNHVVSLESLTKLIIAFGNYQSKVSENFLASTASRDMTTASETKIEVQKGPEVTEPQTFVPCFIFPPSAACGTVMFYR